MTTANHEITFAMIKPDAVRAGNSGKIIDMIEKNGFEILRLHKIMLDKEGAEGFYAVHKDRPFFKELVDFVSSGPVIIMALGKENAIQDWRKLMGATDPLKADAGTIRKLFGADISSNAVHGSDAQETANQELEYFFAHEAGDTEDEDFDDEDGEFEDSCCSSSCDDCQC